MSNDIGEKISDLRFFIEKSLRYHQRRRGHYETMHRILMFIVVISGSAAASEIPRAPIYLAFLASLCGVLDLVYAPGLYARQHMGLHEGFSALLAEILRKTNPTESDLAEWLARRIDLEVKEPPVYWALEADCYNEVAYAWGRKSNVRLTLFQRLLMQFWRFETLGTR